MMLFATWMETRNQPAWVYKLIDIIVAMALSFWFGSGIYHYVFYLRIRHREITTNCLVV